MRERTHGEGFATRAIHAGERPDPTTHAHATPIYATATFAFDTAADKEAAVDARARVGSHLVLLLADGQPDEPRARGEDRVARGRGGLRRLGVGDGVRGGDAVRAPRPGRPPRGRATSCSSSPRCCWRRTSRGAGIDVTPVDMTDLGGGRGGDHGPHEDRCSSRRRRTRGCGCRTSPRSPPSATGTGSSSSPTTRSSARPSCGRSSTAPTSSSTPRRSTCPGTATPSRAWSRARRRLLDPIRKQTDTLRPGGQPVLVASSSCAASGRCRCARATASANAARHRRASSRPTSKVEWVRYPGLASHPDHGRRDAPARRRPVGAMVTFKPRGGVEGMAAFTDHLAPVRHRREPGRRVHARLPAPEGRRDRPRVVGCEDVEDLLEDFELGLSFVG